MKLQEITNQKDLDNFVTTNSGDFLQSWSWGDFQISLGAQVSRLAVLDDHSQIMATLSLIRKSLPGGYSYWFSPRGPVMQLAINDYQLSTVWNFLVEELNKIAHQEKIAFLRFEPPVTNDQTSFKSWCKLVQSPNVIKTLDLEPSQTTVLDLSLSPSDLLAKMHQKTRYNIRLAEKKGVEIFVAGAQDFADWWTLLQATGTRDGFRLHSQAYYQAMLATPGMKLYLARYHQASLAGILVSEFGSTVTYVHGASSNHGRHLMAPYLLQWQAIRDARQASYGFYDFYGVDKLKWPGVTKFKEGFAGQNLAYLGTFDLVWLRGYYKFYGFIRRIFRLINKLKTKLVSK